MEQTELIALVEETLEVRPGTVSLKDSLEGLDWDSLANISFIAAIDEKLGVTLNSERLAKCTSPADLLSLVRESN